MTKLITRSQYINDPRKLDASGNYDSDYASKIHHEYYSQYVNQGVLSMVARSIGVEEIKKSLPLDKHLNNIPLAKWDRLELDMRMLVNRALLKELGESWSLSTSVCIAKTAARILAGMPTGWSHID